MILVTLYPITFPCYCLMYLGHSGLAVPLTPYLSYSLGTLVIIPSAYNNHPLDVCPDHSAKLTTMTFTHVISLQSQEG